MSRCITASAVLCMCAVLARPAGALGACAAPLRQPCEGWFQQPFPRADTGTLQFRQFGSYEAVNGSEAKEWRVTPRWDTAVFAVEFPDNMTVVGPNSPAPMSLSAASPMDLAGTPLALRPRR